MQYLYLDNFRGFKDTYIPIKDVNFLVGENSSGKTSILGLLRFFLLGSFRLQHSFYLDDLNIAFFKDIVPSRHSKHAFFNIGFISQTRAIEAILMTYIEDSDGHPVIFNLTYLINNRCERIVFNKGNETEKIDIEINIINSIEKFVGLYYKEWIQAHLNEWVKYDRSKISSKTGIKFFELGYTSAGLYERLRFNFQAGIFWLAPIRTKPKRIYDEYKSEYSFEGEHTPNFIKKILNGEYGEDIAKNFKERIQEFGIYSGLFESITEKKFGKDLISPFELRIKLNKLLVNIVHTGYGVSQSLPILVEFIARRKGTWFAVQQPEVHLHPKAQAALGDLVYDLFIEDKKKFIIETHSDYLIDRFRLNLKNKKANDLKAQILFFERTEDGNKVTPIEIESDGRLSENQPHTYREFFINEVSKLLDEVDGRCVS